MADTSLMLPPPSRAPKRKLTALEEDEYTSKIEAIIERDFFPDILKLRNQLEWVQALNSGDPSKIRQAQISIAKRRAGLKTPHPAEQTPATWHTPGTALCTPLMTPLTQAGSQTPGLGLHEEARAILEQLQKAPNMSLDEFFSKFTSEDNESFSRIQDESTAKHRAKIQHLLEDKNQPLLLDAPNTTDEYGTTGQKPGTLIQWKHVPDNRLFYSSTKHLSAPLSTKEKAELALGAPKQVVAKATRFPTTDADPQSTAQNPQNPNLTGLMSIDPMHNAPTTSSRYGVLSTPLPSADATPLMTWGEIGSTPIRLDVNDLPAFDPTAATGPSFSIAQHSKREELARSLGVKATANLKRGGRTPSLQRPNTSSSTPVMSPAARKLVSQLRAPSTASDKQLRASYTTPSRNMLTPSARSHAQAYTRTPLAHGGDSRGTTPAGLVLGAQHSGAGSESQNVSKPDAVNHGQGLTDDLLRI